MPKQSDVLAILHARWVARRSEESSEAFRGMDGRRARHIERMAARGIVTVGDLIEGLRRLSPALREASLALIGELKIRQAVPVLLDLLVVRSIRLQCADALSLLTDDPVVTQRFLEIGLRELASAAPDRHWLDVAIRGLGASADPRATEWLVDVFERDDLPGWLRGDAADKLGGFAHASVRDRRTRVHRRCRDAALRGLGARDPCVRFGSMYVVASLALGNRARLRPACRLDGLEKAIPALRRIAKADRRLAPGFWWPMSAEAEDALHCLRTGRPPVPEAAERWPSSGRRGAWKRA